MDWIANIMIARCNNVIEFCLENMSMWCNSIEELEWDFANIKSSYEAFKII